jgi:hypothetical protein
VPSWQNKPKYENNLIYYTKKFKQILEIKHAAYYFILLCYNWSFYPTPRALKSKHQIILYRHDRSATSRELINKFETSSYFNVSSEFQSKKSQFTNAKGNIDVILEILFTLNAI